MRKIYALVAVILAVCLCFALAGCGDDGSDTGSVNPNAVGKPRYGINEEATMNNVSVKLNSFKTVEDSEKAKPADGNEFVLFDFTIKNNSAKVVNMSAMLYLSVYADGKVAPYNLLAQYSKGDKPSLDGDIQKGAELNGVVVYEVPKDWKMIEIHCTPKFWDSKDMIFVANQA